jgi:ATP/maltotriose-dependent transcriptional regulator MalT
MAKSQKGEDRPMGFVSTSIEPQRLGRQAVARERLLALLEDIGRSRVTTVSAPAGYGKTSAMGGNVRVGLEDSLWAGKGRLARSNAEQVRAARQIIEGLGLAVASPAEARQILALKGGDRTAI